jgi:hypothetical protein
MRCLGLPRCQQAHGHLTAASVSLCDQHRSRTLHRLRCQSSSKLVLRETAGSRTTTYTLTSHTEGPSTLHHTTTSSTVTDSGSDADEQQQLLSQQQDAAASPMAGLTARLHELYLPAGFPASVTPDYLPYQLSTIPAHVTGWLSHSLVTSSLLKAVGINAGGLVGCAGYTPRGRAQLNRQGKVGKQCLSVGVSVEGPNPAAALSAAAAANPCLMSTGA